MNRFNKTVTLNIHNIYFGLKISKINEKMLLFSVSIIKLRGTTLIGFMRGYNCNCIFRFKSNQMSVLFMLLCYEHKYSSLTLFFMKYS